MVSPKPTSTPSPMPTAGQVVGRPEVVTKPKPSATATESASAAASSSASTSNFATNIVARAAAQGVTIDPTFTPKAVDFWSTLDSKEMTAIASYLKKLGKPVKSKADLLDTISAYFPDAYKATNIDGVISSLKDQIIVGFSGDQNEPKLPTKQITEVDPAVINSIVRSVYQNRLGRNEKPEELAADVEAANKMIQAGQVATTKVVDGKTVTTYTPAFSQARLEESIGQKIETATDPSLKQDYLEKQSLDFIDFLTKMKG